MTQGDDQEADLHGLAAMRSTHVLAFLLPFTSLSATTSKVSCWSTSGRR